MLFDELFTFSNDLNSKNTDRPTFSFRNRKSLIDYLNSSYCTPCYFLTEHDLIRNVTSELSLKGETRFQKKKNGKKNISETRCRKI